MAKTVQAPRGTRHAGTAAEDSTLIRYGQCWEDADILLEALDVREGDVCLSVTSAGDNTLALLSKSPGLVVAVDLNPAQIACLELRVAAYRELRHEELLELLGSSPSKKRDALYRRCRALLSPNAKTFWDAQPQAIASGIGGAGKLERYLSAWREWIHPLIHSDALITSLLQPRSREEREEFYARHWDNWRWQLMFRAFFSRRVMGRLGRDPSLFRYVHGRIGGRLLERTRHALTALDPVANPYLQWILTGRHVKALPYSLREENFNLIRANLDRLEWHRASVEEWLAGNRRSRFDCFNLSNIFEYMAKGAYHEVLLQLCRAARPGARLAYWNLFVPRRRPESMGRQLRTLADLASALHQRDKAFFYSAFVLEEVVASP